MYVFCFFNGWYIIPHKHSVNLVCFETWGRFHCNRRSQVRSGRGFERSVYLCGGPS